MNRLVYRPSVLRVFTVLHSLTGSGETIIHWKPEKEKTEVKLIHYDKVAKCDAVFVEESEIKRLLPGYFDQDKRTDVWPVDFQNEPKPAPEPRTLRSIPDKQLIKKGLMAPNIARHRVWKGHGKRPLYLQWNEFRIVK